MKDASFITHSHGKMQAQPTSLALGALNGDATQRGMRCLSVLLGLSIACPLVIRDLLIDARSVRTSLRANRCTFSQFFVRVRSLSPSATSPCCRLAACSVPFGSGAVRSRWQVGATHRSILAALPKSVGHLRRTDVVEVWSVGHRARCH